MNLSQHNLNEVLDTDVYSSVGSKIGTVGAIYLDAETGQPEWVTVKTGLFGSKESFVPVRDASLEDNGLRVRYDTDTVKNAPRIDVDDEPLTPDEEKNLYGHYGLSWSAVATDPGGHAGDRDGPVMEPRYTDSDMSGHTTSGMPRQTDSDMSGHTTSGMPRQTDSDMSGHTTSGMPRQTASDMSGRRRLREYVATDGESDQA